MTLKKREKLLVMNPLKNNGELDKGLKSPHFNYMAQKSKIVALILIDEYGNSMWACRYETIMWWINNAPNLSEVKEYINKHGIPRQE